MILIYCIVLNSAVLRKWKSENLEDAMVAK